MIDYSILRLKFTNESSKSVTFRISQGTIAIPKTILYMPVRQFNCLNDWERDFSSTVPDKCAFQELVITTDPATSQRVKMFECVQFSLGLKLSEVSTSNLTVGHADRISVIPFHLIEDTIHCSYFYYFVICLKIKRNMFFRSLNHISKK